MQQNKTQVSSYVLSHYSLFIGTIHNLPVKKGMTKRYL
jgi:hypothetical protein